MEGREGTETNRRFKVRKGTRCLAKVLKLDDTTEGHFKGEPRVRKVRLKNLIQ